MGKHTPGPKELQRIALRERRYDERGPGARRHAKALARMKPAEVEALRNLERKILTEASPSKPNIAPVSASALPQETTMKKAKTTTKLKIKKRSVSEAAANLRAAKKTTARKASASKTKPKAKTSASANARTKVAGESAGVRPGSKLAIVVGLLTRPEGCTGKDILEATGWPTCSVPQQAKAAGLVLSKEKDGKVSRYRGVAAAPAAGTPA